MRASQMGFGQSAYLPTSPEGRHKAEVAAWPTYLRPWNRGGNILPNICLTRSEMFVSSLPTYPY